MLFLARKFAILSLFSITAFSNDFKDNEDPSFSDSDLHLLTLEANRDKEGILAGLSPQTQELIKNTVFSKQDVLTFTETPFTFKSKFKWYQVLKIFLNLMIEDIDNVPPPTVLPLSKNLYDFSIPQEWGNHYPSTELYRVEVVGFPNSDNEINTFYQNFIAYAQTEDIAKEMALSVCQNSGHAQCHIAPRKENLAVESNSGPDERHYIPGVLVFNGNFNWLIQKELEDMKQCENTAIDLLGVDLEINGQPAFISSASYERVGSYSRVSGVDIPPKVAVSLEELKGPIFYYIEL